MPPKRWLEPRRRAEQAPVAVVAEAYAQGVSTRKVEALVQTLGTASMSKSEVSRLGAALEEQATIFRTRRLDATYPYLWLDARYEHVREDGRVVSMAVIVAYGVRADRVRDVPGVEVGLSEDVALWRAFLQELVARGDNAHQHLTVLDHRPVDGPEAKDIERAVPVVGNRLHGGRLTLAYLGGGLHRDHDFSSALVSEMDSCEKDRPIRLCTEALMLGPRRGVIG